MKTKIWLIIAVVAILVIAGSAKADTITVGLGVGYDFNTIQAGIDSANDGDTVIVANGTYTGEGNRDIDFLGKAITVRSENGPENCIIDCNGTWGDEHRGFYFNSNEDTNSILNGFTVTNGFHYYGSAICCDGSSPTINNCIIYGNSTVYGLAGGGICCRSFPKEESSPNITNCTIRGNNGGGIFCQDSSPTITNCAIIGNTARSGLLPGTGAGIQCSRSRPTIANCEISDNSVESGEDGAISCIRGSLLTIANSTISKNKTSGIFSQDSSLIVNNCTITGNKARDGGGIYCISSSPTIINCAITGNWSDFGGGIYCYNSSPTISNSTITGNSAGGGGGVHCRGEGNPTINNCIISNNSASHGGGIHSLDGSLTITNCTINSNTTNVDGGGIYCHGTETSINDCKVSNNLSKYKGGGILFSVRQLYDTLTIANCIISQNTADTGAGIYLNYCGDGNLTLTNCTIVGNSASDKAGGIFGGIGVYFPHQGESTVTNCIIRDNSPQQIYDPVEYISVTYSNVQDDYPGEGNIDTDPCFVLPGYWTDANDPNIIVEPNDPNAVWIEGDYHLLPTSPCIDTGDPNYIPEPNETDLDGNPRISGTRIDMGAFESNYIEVEMNFTPKTINYSSKGNWVKAHITLPDEFLPEDVDVNTPAWAEPIDIDSEYVKLLGGNPVKLEIVFNREAFCAQITEPGWLEITIIGSLTTGQNFFATDKIKVINKPDNKSPK